MPRPTKDAAHQDCERFRLFDHDRVRGSGTLDEIPLDARYLL